MLNRLEGLFVAGEDSGGVHGANRLGGNGVAESTGRKWCRRIDYFWAIAGDVMSQYVEDKNQPTIDPAQAESIIAEVLSPFSFQGDENIHTIRQEIEGLMWDKGGLVRNGPDLKLALAELDRLEERVGLAPVSEVKEFNLSWQEWLDVKSILTVARLTCQSALARKESRGSHYRSDYPNPDDQAWLSNILVQRNSTGDMQVWSEPVKLDRLRPDQAG